MSIKTLARQSIILQPAIKLGREECLGSCSYRTDARASPGLQSSEGVHKGSQFWREKGSVLYQVPAPSWKSLRLGSDLKNLSIQLRQVLFNTLAHIASSTRICSRKLCGMQRSVELQPQICIQFKIPHITHTTVTKRAPTCPICSPPVLLV